jgi:hypothetical protein
MLSSTRVIGRQMADRVRVEHVLYEPLFDLLNQSLQGMRLTEEDVAANDLARQLYFNVPIS